MFRISHLLKTMTLDTPVKPARKMLGPVVIWNLIRRCNLSCKHCYATSLDIDFSGELSTQEIKDTMDDLKLAHVPVLILSGGEPLMRPDIFELTAYAKSLGFYLALSTNGTLINENNIAQIKAAQYQYVGISIDGLEAYHDEFRRQKGSFKASLHAIELCKKVGIKVGLRLCLTRDNKDDLEAMLDLMETCQVDKFYMSHLNYSGRGKRNADRDAMFEMTKKSMEQLFERAWQHILDGRESDFVTGNNDADGPFLLQWAHKKFANDPIYAPRLNNLKQHLINWGGNASGVNVANIDNTGTIHPDTYWWNHPLGNVRKEKFSDVWANTQDPLMLGFRQSPRPVKGRCAHCQYLNICGGNTRTRAFAQTGDPWAEDPGCYLTNHEIGIAANKKTIRQIEVTQL
ncbi:heme d1 biosynthesis radical SAM protein NirJ [Pseudoalteromonas denitrificans]|uniref:Pre-heme d1 synthase n=1 Tax=Pseudoalteromonas denitrificans DSM 6059 TaxID=1123010 RepID=A0A1I1N351_9GAMM|nr:heme d1 biosynthesis radical SAM protein NirJ [Pseudoalteromonas denitrificans]SFC88220.1 heme d1 biosynthesis radical SAM protein NirJ [Pseudoalteromonas denitrificans DSM 6059]